MTDQSTMRRLRALLAKAEGTDNPHEAAAFMGKVREMLDTHNLTMTDLERTTSQDVLNLLLPSQEMWVKILVGATAEYYDCAAVFMQDVQPGHDGGVIYGREGARTVCERMLPYILSTITRIARADPAVTERGIGEAFTRRVIVLLRQRQSSPVTGSTALTILSEAQQAMNAAGETSSEMVQVGRSSVLEYIYAESISLGEQIEAAQPARRIR